MINAEQHAKIEVSAAKVFRKWNTARSITILDGQQIIFQLKAQNNPQGLDLFLSVDEALYLCERN
jgi:hypothetical protein